MTTNPDNFAAAASLLRASHSPLILTGAGISTGAGIPDYRGPQGVWTKNPAAERHSDAQTYATDSQVRIAYWARLRARLNPPPQPTPAHRALVALEDRGLAGIVTQNIDGLHLAAGTSPDHLVEIHGHTRVVRCLSCAQTWPTLYVITRPEADPTCEVCGGVLSTLITRFGDIIDPVQNRRVMIMLASADLLLCVGSTLYVQPVASLVPRAMGRHLPVIIINDQPTEYDSDATVLRGDIQDVVPAIIAALS